MNSIDRDIINRIQSDLPIEPRPYKAIADDLGLSEDELITRLKNLKASGVIRRIGGNFVPEKLGFVSTLCAAQVPEEKIDLFSREVNKYPGVTHNYQRDHCFNIWFTFIAESRVEIEENLRKIAEKTGVEKIMNLPATRVFKVRAMFEV